MRDFDDNRSGELMRSQNEERIIDVAPEHVETRVQPDVRIDPKCRAAQSTGYTHHQGYGEDYEPPEIPNEDHPYSSVRAKILMLGISFALIGVSTNLVHAMKQRLGDGGMVTVAQTLDIQDNSIDMIHMNAQALEASLSKMQLAVDEHGALSEVTTALHKGRTLSDEEARKLLQRAGYMPSAIDDQKIEEVKRKHAKEDFTVEDDVAFARNVAGDIVQDEVESFVYKMKLLNSVGEYVYNRVSE